MIDGRYFKYAKMPMGLCCSPAYLDNRLREILPRRMGRCRNWVYMDDIGFWGPTLREVETVGEKLVGILQAHKFTVAAEKCHIGKEIVFAKLTVNDKGVSLTENKIDDIEQKFMEVLNSRQATKSGWASIRGLLNAHMTCLPTDATRVVRDITWLINKNNSVPWHRTPIALPLELIPVIRNFLAVLRNDRIMSSDTHTPILIVDSSTEFWGGILHTGHGRHTINLQGPHTTQTKTRIGQNTLEAEAVKKGIEETHKVLPFRHEKKGYALKVYCDNMAVVAGITHPEKLNHKQKAFYNRIQATLQFCEYNGICLSVTHIPGEENPADEISRPNLTREECAIKARKQEVLKESQKKKKLDIQNVNYWKVLEDVEESEDVRGARERNMKKMQEEREMEECTSETCSSVKDKWNKVCRDELGC
eukprot:GHVR01150537.1.p1 GENE.GHVR01150537.1~~GHVR01150537.1.p1  ORF type:complete len:419 (-),score=50.53 GHVR01150537.1:165-1421(-)